MTEMTKRWNFDMFIAKEIADQADWMIRHGHTVPENTTTEQWHDVLVRVRDGFAAYSRSPASPRPNEALELFVEHFDKWWD